MIKYTNTIDNFDELKGLCWSGAIHTLNIIEENNMEDEFMNLLEEMFFDTENITITGINDFIWFDDDFIFENLGIEIE